MKTLNPKMLIAVLLACAPMLASAKGDIEEGKKKSETCKACHGEGGAKPVQPEYPVLAGQHEDYLAAALNQYKSGKRKNALMTGFAGALSPQDIRNLAAYFASEKSELKNKY
jgi:cytochrome c553